MSWTKQQLITQAYEEIGYASYVYDLEPEQIQAALRRLDGMMATWTARGINLGYPIPSSPQNSSLDEETQIPDWATEAVYLNLAKLLCPTVGKESSLETRTAAKSAYRAVLQRCIKPNKMNFPSTLPLGAGNKTHGSDSRRYILPETDSTITAPDEEVSFNGL